MYPALLAAAFASVVTPHLAAAPRAVPSASKTIAGISPLSTPPRGAAESPAATPPTPPPAAAGERSAAAADTDLPLAVLAVLAVSASGGAPAPELVEMTHQLRGACRERDPSVQGIAEMRARLLGERAPASLAELDRAWAGAVLAAAQGDPAGAARTLRGIVAELERGAESEEAFELWSRAMLRVAYAELAAGRSAEYHAALERVADVDPAAHADPDQYSPTFRRDLAAAKNRVASRPRHPLRIALAAPDERAAEAGAVDGSAAASPAETHTGPAAQARPAPIVFVDGRPVGPAPLSLLVSPGVHRVGAIAGNLRVPAVSVEVGPGGAEVALDVALASAVNVNAGPALALAGQEGRESAIVRVGAWLGAARVLATSLEASPSGAFLVGAAYDVERAELVREGRVRLVKGLAPPEHVSALSTFLLTGQPSAAIVAARPGAGARALDLSASAAPSRKAWLRRGAIGAAALAAGAGAFALHQLDAARAASKKADALLRADGAMVGDPAAYARHRSAAAAGRRNAWIGAAGAAVFAAAAGALGYLSWDADRGPVVRF